MKKIIIMLMLLSACTGNESKDRKKTNLYFLDKDKFRLFNDTTLEYIKDPRTNLCFSVVRYDRSLNVSNVPCSPEVEKLIESE